MLTERREQKNVGSFEPVAIPHMDLLYNYALHLTTDPEDANDLLQETYLKAFRFWHKFEQGTNIRAWLFRIMKNSYINDYRQKVKEPQKVDYEDERVLHEKNHEPFSDGVFQDDVEKAINSLPEIFKTAVLLNLVEGLSYEEIADFTDCPLGTVRSRIHRGRRMLRRSLNGFARQNGYVMESC